MIVLLVFGKGDRLSDVDAARVTPTCGFLARALVPGRQSMSVLQTILLGVVG